MDRFFTSIAGCEIEICEGGVESPPVLFLHGGTGFRSGDAFVSLLAAKRRLICPSHPGFGASALPDWIDSVDDIAHIYLELMDKLGLTRIDLVGCSIGGWIAVEMATKAPERFRRIALVGPVGVKTGPPEKLDIPDIFVLPQADVENLLFHDPQRLGFQPASLSDDELAAHVRNRETLTLLTWEPYMHNPKLPHRLHRIASPTLFMRGASDGLVSEAYLSAYAKLTPQSSVSDIARAGHMPHLEQPQAFAETVLNFLHS